MTEVQAIEIATQYVVENSRDECTLEAVRRFKKGELTATPGQGDTWVVQFRVDYSENFEPHVFRILVDIDDVTAETQFFDTL